MKGLTCGSEVALGHLEANEFAGGSHDADLGNGAIEYSVEQQAEQTPPHFGFVPGLEYVID